MMNSIANILDRSFDNDGVITYVDSTWEQVRRVRNELLSLSDCWYPKDRWDSLSTTDKGAMNTFRQDLRDLPATYDTPNDAWDNMPEPPSWSAILPELI